MTTSLSRYHQANVFTIIRRVSICAAFGLSALVAGAADDSATQAERLLARMTLDEKIGQMTQVDMEALTDKADVKKYFLGSVLSGGSSDPTNNLAATWLQAVSEFKSYAQQTRLKIPLIYGIDAVHGHNNVDGAVIFPHNIGLGATRNATLVERAARVTAEEVAGTGVRWAFAPCVAVVQNERWGRTYEGFSDDPQWSGDLGRAAIKGLQGATLSGGPASVLACAKHFIGDGGTRDGIDQGDTICDEAALRRIYLPPYAAAVRAGVGSVMISYSSWNGVKMHGHKYLITDVLKGELGFKGFVVSDWAAIDQISKDYKHDVEVSINAGLDMIMIPYGPGKTNNYVQFLTHLKELVAEGKVSQSRIDDAVRRILTIKFQMGLFADDQTNPKLTAAIGSPEHRQVARECVQQSLVLLKNSGDVLPLSKRTKSIVVVGAAADDLGVQCGGWTISWQGGTGAVTKGGTTILAGIRNVLGKDAAVKFSPDGANLDGASVAVVVIGEKPYAEMKGDRNDLRLSEADAKLVQTVKQAGVPVVTVLLSGRPLVLEGTLEASDALVAAWLPGTEGQGVADVLFGDVKPTGKLPRHWPRTNEQLGQTTEEIALYPRGFGLNYSKAKETAGL